ncbi:adenylyl-sulfate kinase [Thermaerobacter composti]|uniref:Multifunctional fusion protein n=1 Tax=Thermaerobacter composti TaxID=554949 RepID=A0ABZ0QNK9_9FIRM|nr:adenylyl-sulfate kinase [Thermaerobacter composti]WPD18362.1 adenylyl-sulfate kinase [Thermaerobacter composti]
MPHRGVTVWFTGLPGAGKSTLARQVAGRLRQQGLPVEVLDGDVLRQSLCRDLGFSADDRRRQAERAAWVAATLTRHGVIVLVAVIAPYRDSREQARREIGDFLEVYVRAPLEVLIQRDPKGLYRRALAGELRGLTGLDDPYEEPLQPDLVCDTARETVAESTARVLALLEERGYVPADAAAARGAGAGGSPGGSTGAEPDATPGRGGPVPGDGAATGDGRRGVAVAGRRPATATAAGPGTAAAAVPGPIAPHGGRLVWRVLGGEARRAALERVAALPRLPLDELAAADLELLATGAYSPLTGFMDRADYQAVVEAMRLASGVVWPLPVTLAVSRGEAAGLREGQEVALVDADHEPVAILQVTDVFPYDKEREARAVFGTADPAHPGVARLLQRGEVLVAGPIWYLGRRDRPLPVGPDGEATEGPAPEPVERGSGAAAQAADPFAPYRLTPWQTRRRMDRYGWRTVVGFQTRNPVHRAHEYLQKVALEMVDGLLLHPLVGPTKADDVPAPVRLRCYLELLRHYYPAQRVLFAVFPAAMRYAGPREAVFHALCRKNYGCTHFIVGRDHAGVGNYYGPYDAQRLFDRFDPDELGITPLKFENAFFCRRCGGMATTKTCPHGDDDRLLLSGTRVRAMLARGELPPPEYSRPEVARILVEAARGAVAKPGAHANAEGQVRASL